MDIISVILGGADVAMCASLRAILDAEPGIRVVGAGASERDLVMLTRRHQPDLLLLEWALIDTATPDLIRTLRGICLHMNVIILADQPDRASALTALQAGARGFLLKGVRRLAILRAIRATVDGQVILDSSTAERVITGLESAGRLGSAIREVYGQLSEREAIVLKLLACGWDPETIAAYLKLNLKTVRNYLASVQNKLQVPTREDAVAKVRCLVHVE